MNSEIQQDSPIKIICVDEGRDLAQQVLNIFPSEAVSLHYERDLDAVVDRFESQHYDLMLFSSSVSHQQPQDAVEIFELIAAKCPETQILFFAPPSRIKLAHEALRAGVFHYAHLPISDEELKMLIITALERKTSLGLNLLLRSEVQKTVFERMVGRSQVMQNVYRQIRQAAATDIPVLLSGETGTGKELAAMAIHELSDRTNAPYLPVHIGSMPVDVVASELFGHEKGAFTGAVAQRKGCFEEAAGGTVFLDEIATIDEKMQVSLLRLLETSEVSRIGGQSSFSIDVRVIAATNADLAHEIKLGHFREDLYYRLDVMQIVMPPLRERHGDIQLLMEHFLKKACDNFGKEIRGISPDFLGRLEQYDWPGNVRELNNVLQRAVVTCTDDILEPRHLPQRFQRDFKEKAVIPIRVGMRLQDAEKALIARTIEYTGGNRTRASDILGISRRALYTKLRKYGID